MIDLAKLIRSDRGLKVNETLIREEVARVMDLERDIANVSFFFLIKKVLNIIFVCHLPEAHMWLTFTKETAS